MSGTTAKKRSRFLLLLGLLGQLPLYGFTAWLLICQSQWGAEMGIAEAQYNLGTRYFTGRSYTLCSPGGCDFPQDDTKAVEWYRKAAEKGHSQAQYSLGNFYSWGRGGLPEDHAEAIEWYRKAAEQGHQVAQMRLGFLYLGHGSVKDFKDEAEAVKWLRKGSEQGNRFMQYDLGKCYYEGTGIPADKAEATIWLRKSAKQGHGDAIALLLKIEKE